MVIVFHIKTYDWAKSRTQTIPFMVVEPEILIWLQQPLPLYYTKHIYIYTYTYPYSCSYIPWISSNFLINGMIWWNIYRNSPYFMGETMLFRWRFPLGPWTLGAGMGGRAMGPIGTIGPMGPMGMAWTDWCGGMAPKIMGRCGKCCWFLLPFFFAESTFFAWFLVYVGVHWIFLPKSINCPTIPGKKGFGHQN